MLYLLRTISTTEGFKKLKKEFENLNKIIELYISNSHRSTMTKTKCFIWTCENRKLRHQHKPCRLLLNCMFSRFFVDLWTVHRSQSTCKFLTTTTEHDTDISSWTRRMNSTLTMRTLTKAWTLLDKTKFLYQLEFNSYLLNYCQSENRVRSMGIEKYTATDNGTYNMLCA